MIKSPWEAAVSDAIVADEIGIETGVYGHYRLKTTYQPIFSLHGDKLFPIVIEGGVEPHFGGRPVPPEMFFGQIPAEQVSFIERVCEALHLRNHRNVGADWLDLLITHRVQASDLPHSLNEMACMVGQLGEIELDPKLLVCEITSAGRLDDQVLTRLADYMRSHGIRIAIGDFGMEPLALQYLTLLRPDVVKLDGDWFRKLAADRSAARLLPAVVRGLRAGGAKVMVHGIGTPLQLQVALGAGVDLLQGILLGGPALAGTIFDAAPREIGELLASQHKVVPLFG